MQFTADQVLQFYNQLQYGASRQAKNDANVNIVNFIESAQAWQVAIQLLAVDRSQQD
jgi:hypothetical protein